MKSVEKEVRKYKRCQKCGLDIRANGATQEEKVANHENGWHHKNKGFKYQR